jgi:hypothetical protein
MYMIFSFSNAGFACLLGILICELSLVVLSIAIALRSNGNAEQF